MNITIWNECSKDEQRRKVKKAYPRGMSEAIAEAFDKEDNITIAHRLQEGQGLPRELLENTDVLFYWAHCHHDEILDETAERVVKRVKEGMGIVMLHSAHFSKIFKMLTNASGSLKWREDSKHERLYNVRPTHPIASGVPCQIYLPKEEMYGEPFDIGEYDDLIFTGWFCGGEIFRSGFTKSCGKGRMFYFQPGHETYPTYYNESIKKILNNAAKWTAGKEVEAKPYKVSKECAYAVPLKRVFGKGKGDF